jgi:hypothetical protein
VLLIEYETVNSSTLISLWLFAPPREKNCLIYLTHKILSLFLEIGGVYPNDNRYFDVSFTCPLK